MGTRIIRYPSGYNERSEYNRGYESRRTRNDNRGYGDGRTYGEDMAYNRRGNRNDYRGNYGGYESNYGRDYGRGEGRMDYGEMRQIGFDSEMYDYEMRNRRGNSYMHGGGQSGGEMSMGHASGSDNSLSFEEAQGWVESMRGADGSKGGRWKIEEVEKLLKERGIKKDPVDLWVGMNALYTDLCEVVKKYGIKDSDVNFWLEAAIAYWLEDEDAVEDKITVYYDCIVK